MKDFNVIVPEYANRIEIEIGDEAGLKNYILVACDRLPSGYGAGDGIFTVMLIDEAGYGYESGSAPIMGDRIPTVELETLLGVSKDNAIEHKRYKITASLIDDESKICVNVKEL